MNRIQTYLFFSLAAFVIFTFIHSEFECTISFPHEYCSQGFKIYQAGEILHTNTYEKTTSFFIKDYAKEKKFYLLIVKPADIAYIFKQIPEKVIQQTIEYRTILPNRPYKFYELTLRENQEWKITETILHDDHIIPDTAVIVFYNPFYIDTVKTSPENGIPSIYLINNLLSTAGGSDSLFYEEIRYLLDTLHMDPLHQKVSYRVTLGNARCKQVIGL